MEMSKLIIEEMRSRLAKLSRPQAFLASLSDDGAPKVRPVTLMLNNYSLFLATARSSNKAKQNAMDSRVEFVTLFCESGSSGYIRVQGLAREITDLKLLKEVTTACHYPVSEYWKGVDDPDFFFFEVKPQRVEYMKPGADRAIEVTNEFVK
jgi:general stress protein 26